MKKKDDIPASWVSLVCVWPLVRKEEFQVYLPSILNRKEQEEERESIKRQNHSSCKLKNSFFLHHYCLELLPRASFVHSDSVPSLSTVMSVLTGWEVEIERRSCKRDNKPTFSKLTKWMVHQKVKVKTKKKEQKRKHQVSTSYLTFCGVFYLFPGLSRKKTQVNLTLAHHLHRHHPDTLTTSVSL